MPPSPKVRSVGSGDAGVADAPLLQRLQDFLGVAGLVDPYEQQQQQVRLRQQSGSGRVGYGSRERQAQQAQQQRGGAAAAAGAAAGPRPYFWRLQQRLGSYRPGGGWGAAAGGSGLGEGPVSDENYALLFRRQVYDNVSEPGENGAWSVGLTAPGSCQRNSFYSAVAFCRVWQLLSTGRHPTCPAGLVGSAAEHAGATHLSGQRHATGAASHRCAFASLVRGGCGSCTGLHTVCPQLGVTLSCKC